MIPLRLTSVIAASALAVLLSAGIAGAQEIKVAHPQGETVLPGVPQKVLVQDWAAFDNLQALEVQDVPRRAMRELLAHLRREGIPAVVVLMPEGSVFRSWYGPKARAATAELIEVAEAETGRPVVDARAWLPDEAFADGHHVRDVAAPAFSARMARECIVPVLAGR